MATLADILAALAAAGIVLDGEAAAAAAPVTVVAAEYVSPLQRLGAASVTKGDSLPGHPLLDTVYRDAMPGHRQRDVRETARIERIPLFSCDRDISLKVASGDITVAAHGYAWKRVAGEPCDKRGDAFCSGKVRK